MDLSFGLTGPQQWAVIIGVVFVLTALISAWIIFAYDYFNTKECWIERLQQLKHRNNIMGR